MKITRSQLRALMSCHIYNVSEEELSAIAFISDIKISSFQKNDHMIKFVMEHKLTKIFVECSKGSCVSMGKSNKVKNHMSGLTGFGGCFSFASIIRVFRGIFMNGYELTISSPEVSEKYNKEEWSDLVFDSIELVEKA